MDLYALLGLESTASVPEIKKAYMQKIRMHSPDRSAEAFMQIRHAYETLSNAQSRLEYDTMFRYGEEIEDFLQDALGAMEDKDYARAIPLLKKILLIEPKLNHVRNYYALCLTYRNEHSKSLIQFRKLVENEPANAVYYFNYGTVLEELEQFDEAIVCIERSLEIDPGNVNVVFHLADLFNWLGRGQEARHIVRRALDGREVDDFAAFVYHFKLLQLEIYDKNTYSIETVLTQIDQLVSAHPEEQVYVAERYAHFAYELYGQKLFSLAINLTERAVQLDPDNEAILEFHQKTESSKLLYKEYELMSADPEISKWVQNFYLLYLFGDEVSEQEFEEYYQTAQSKLYEAARYEPEEILHSIRRLVIKYPLLFEQRKEWLQKFMKICKDSVQARNQ